uniref:Uncharacterized protein n=1 Tax=Arundo donax TaxID=35708 RepID=A0A0A9BSB5_ARUDO
MPLSNRSMNLEMDVLVKHHCIRTRTTNGEVGK